MGFFGGIDLDTVYYDIFTNKLTFTEWGRNGFPFRQFPEKVICGISYPYTAMLKKSEGSKYLGMD
jgi:hypothetical protein